MFSALLIFFVLLSIWSDWRIYKSFVISKGRVFSWLWYTQSAVSVAPFLILFIGGFFIDLRWTSWVLFSLWYISFFLVQFVLKIFIAIAIQIGKKWCMNLAVILSSSLAIIYIYGVFVSRCDVDVRQVDIESKSLPKSFDGYRVAMISDIHLGTMSLDGNLLERVVDSINVLDPDIVIHCGDIINIDVNEFTKENIDILGRIKAPVYSVYGNHDLGLYFKDTVEIDPIKMVDSLRYIESTVLGWTLLDNQHKYIVKERDSIAIAGVTYANNLSKYNNSVCGRSDINKAMDGIPETDFSVLISHTPVLADSLPLLGKNRSTDLMLSGHTHAMQLRIAGICPSFFLYKYPSGLYDIEGTTLYVNGGIGYVGHPFRLGASPEITLFTLKSI